MAGWLPLIQSSVSPQERLLWSRLRRRRLAGFRFRRKATIGPYIADFYCHEAGLVVVLDGSCRQSGESETDCERLHTFGAWGLSVLRFTEGQVEFDLDSVIVEIEYYLAFNRCAI